MTRMRSSFLGVLIVAMAMTHGTNPPRLPWPPLGIEQLDSVARCCSPPKGRTPKHAPDGRFADNPR